MARDIETGIDSIAKHLQEKQVTASEHQWRDLRNKVDSLLLSSNVLKSDESRRACLEMDDMVHDERVRHITRLWGKAYLDRVMPLLHQISVLEKRLNNQIIPDE